MVKTNKHKQKTYNIPDKKIKVLQQNKNCMHTQRWSLFCFIGQNVLAWSIAWSVVDRCIDTPLKKTGFPFPIRYQSQVASWLGWGLCPLFISVWTLQVLCVLSYIQLVFRLHHCVFCPHPTGSRVFISRSDVLTSDLAKVRVVQCSLAQGTVSGTWVKGIWLLATIENETQIHV